MTDYEAESIALDAIEKNLKKWFDTSELVLAQLQALPCRDSVIDAIKEISNGLADLRPDYKALKEGFHLEWDAIKEEMK